VAKDADIYIPALCAHKDLANFGSCRLCLVKIDGMRGFPPACSTPARDDMVVTTSDDELVKIKRNILELLLSEHPNSCILCDDKDLCEKYRSCPTKAGQITGCQLCPSKEFCELRKVIEYLGVEKVDYEFNYKDVELKGMTRSLTGITISASCAADVSGYAMISGAIASSPSPTGAMKPG